MGWFRKFFEKDDWRFVGQVESPYKHQRSPVHDWEPFELTYYLYENQHGDRKFDVIDSRPHRGDLDVDELNKNDWVFRNDQYRTIIHPWMNGFRNKKFPTYEKAPMHDFKRFLEEE